ncbi:hypothetical protein [Mesorhizobium sp.]|uniref:hypothetical protein n=1 Tax=Mesorhizobium sp. TaxID=1871066 RepID=UPI000FE91D21|nr:hypothetical protein [Mesorhizobium sp.]RWM25560.1 MAG: hypothetical protein EOR74_18545 [Mesorhizobium sp.]RWM38815.1 MAG: hypothetical protein EOR75_16760 [Mesorhizobium sp.]TJV51442.1 MAG: hypothetical protein E5Y01_14325 [Mesorhizobium sp.]
MTRLFTACLLTGFALTGASVAAALEPGSGHNVHLAAVDGVVYYTVEPDGYRVVATLASGADALPIRVISTLVPGQRLLISVPRSVGQPSIDFEILRNGDALVVSDPAATVDLVGEVSAPGALEK